MKSPASSNGGWSVMSGSVSPLSGTPVGQPVGTYQAMLDQANRQPYTGSTNPTSATIQVYERHHAS